MSTKIIVGITTTPIRLNAIGRTILSLLSQSKKPDEIVLTIPKTSARFGTPYEIKDMLLLRLIELKKITLNEINDDYGPATKFVGLILKNYHPDDILIWVDDDIVYNSFVVEKLISIIQPNNAVGLSGFNFDINGNYCKVVSHLGIAEVLEGYLGVACYKKNMPIINDFEKYNIRSQTFESLKIINKVVKAQFLSDDYIISTFFKLTNILNIVYCKQEFFFGNCVQILDIGNKEDALHNQVGGNMYNYNLLRNNNTKTFISSYKW